MTSPIAPPVDQMVEFNQETERVAASLLTPARFNLLVRLYKTPRQLASGLYVSDKSKDDINISECRAEVWLMSEMCFQGREWPKGNTLSILPGDWILMASYAGGQVNFMKAFPDEQFRLIADTEILARIASPEEVNRKW